jgi:hypothetical protein
MYEAGQAAKKAASAKSGAIYSRKALYIIFKIL